MLNVDDKSSVLLVGATGYVGRLVATGLLAHERCRIVAPLRQGNTHEGLIDKVKIELAAEGLDKEVDFSRLVTVTMPAIDEPQSWLTAFGDMNVREIIHCAGSVDYFDSAKLKEANIDLTARLISLGKELRVQSFIYVSTAFSSGYLNGLVREALHTTFETDPTEYTLSKREAEAIVAHSGLPFLIVRPSIVIGDSRDGRYSGKPYGLYQYWIACEKFLCDRYRDDLHLIAPMAKLQVIHQDAFTASFLAARRQLPDNSFVHLVSQNDSLPTVRQASEMWNEMCTRSRRLHCYNNLSEVPSEGLDRRARMFLEFTAINSDISSHHWQFQTAALAHLRKGGLDFRDATLDTLRTCQRRFAMQSSRIQAIWNSLEQQPAAVSSL